MGKKLTEMKRKNMLNSLCLEHLKKMYKDGCYWKRVGIIYKLQVPKTKSAYIKHLDSFVNPAKGFFTDRFRGNPFLIKLIKKKARFSTGQKRKLAVKSKHRCEICKKLLDTVPDIHHIKPVEEGGFCSEKNGIVVCPTCHRKAGNGEYTEKQLKQYISYRC